MRPSSVRREGRAPRTAVSSAGLNRLPGRSRASVPSSDRSWSMAHRHAGDTRGASLRQSCWSGSSAISASCIRRLRREGSSFHRGRADGGPAERPHAAGGRDAAAQPAGTPAPRPPLSRRSAGEAHGSAVTRVAVRGPVLGRCEADGVAKVGRKDTKHLRPPLNPPRLLRPPRLRCAVRSPGNTWAAPLHSCGNAAAAAAAQPAETAGRPQEARRRAQRRRRLLQDPALLDEEILAIYTRAAHTGRSHDPKLGYDEAARRTSAIWRRTSGGH